jgi:hypothetical protein
MARLPRPCLDCATLTTEPVRCVRCSRTHRRTHRDARTAAQAKVEMGLTVCSRCGLPIYAYEKWDIDRRDGRFTPSHRACNRAPRAGAGGRG